MIKQALGTSIVGISLALAGSAHALKHDYNGAAAGGVVDSAIWDWAPANALFEGIAPIPGGGGTIEGTLYLQGSFSTNGTGSNPLSDFEDTWTYQAVIPITATVIASALGNDFSIYGNSGGTFNIYYDALVNHDDIAGTGYDDGTLIYSGDVLDLSPSFGSLNVFGALDEEILDQFGGNNQLGVTTVQMEGSVTFDIDTTFEHQSFFGLQSTSDEEGIGLADGMGNGGDGIGDINWSSSTLAPFTQANPSDLVVGVTPDYDGAGLSGVNDNTCTAAANCDIHVQTDAASAIPPTIPEPTTVALLGIGLAGLGASRRLRRDS